MQRIFIKERSPFVLFLPLLFLYILYVCYFHTDEMEGDEARYLEFAENLLHGFYSPPYPAINLINGPGYPIVLIPFVLLKLPLICITLFNAVLHYLSVVFLFKAVQFFSAYRTACIAALCWGFNILAYQEMSCILTEGLTLFLTTLFSYHIIKMYASTTFSYRLLCLTGFIFGFLILTKVIFAYVLLILILCAGLHYLIYRQSTKRIKLVWILTAAFVTILPYIAYTYSLTGKIFYLSSEGGKVFYWMTSLDPHEYGDWNNNYFTANCVNKNEFCNAALIAKHHSADIARINDTKSVIETDSLFKAMAIANIKSDPVKYIQNWFANIGRMLFGFPASYYFQSPKTLVRIYIHSVLLLALVYSSIVSMVKWKKTPLEIKILIGFSMLYLGLSSLVSAYPRQLNVVVPVLLIWITYIIKNTIKIDLKTNLPH